MKIDYSSVNKKDIEKLLLDKRMNIAAADILFEFCFYSREHQINKDNYAGSIAEYAELNLNDKEDNLFYKSRIAPAVKELKSEEYDDNYYRKHIRPKEFAGDGYTLTYLTLPPYNCLPYDDISVDSDYVEVSHIGFFKDAFKYLVVNKDDVTWMSTDPNEINTMKPAILEAKGHVLAFGLGLGYFPIMAALKDDVFDVTVIENDPEIIEIFNKHILPCFEKKEKIHVIQGDAFAYAKRDLKEYDYLFVDIWHNPEDGLPMYLKISRLLKNKNIKSFYWLEKSILAMLRRCLLTIVEENMMGYTKKDYLHAKNEYDRIINDLYFKTENFNITSFSQLKELLQDNNLRKLI